MIEVSEAPEEKDRYYFQLAELQFSQGEKEEAALNYRKIVGANYQEKVIERLEDVYTNDHQNLITVLTQKLNILKHKDEKTKVYLKLAELKDKELNELDAALLFYEKALLLTPHVDTIENICDILWRKEDIHQWYLYKKQKIAMLDNKARKNLCFT